MSKFLPIENIILKTKLSKEQTIQRLTDNIEAQKSFGFGAHNYGYSKPYIGLMYGSYFDVKKAISYRNSFLPEIKGEVYSEFDGTKIKIRMKPNAFVLVFMSIWFGGVFIGCFAAVYAMFSQEFTPVFILPFVMLFFGIALLFGGFKTESSTSKKDFKRILEAEIQ